MEKEKMLYEHENVLRYLFSKLTFILNLHCLIKCDLEMNKIIKARNGRFRFLTVQLAFSEGGQFHSKRSLAAKENRTKNPKKDLQTLTKNCAHAHDIHKLQTAEHRIKKKSEKKHGFNDPRPSLPCNQMTIFHRRVHSISQQKFLR